MNLICTLQFKYMNFIYSVSFTDLWLIFVNCRYDMANPRSGFFHGLLTRPSRILSISGTQKKKDLTEMVNNQSLRLRV